MAIVWLGPIGEGISGGAAWLARAVEHLLNGLAEVVADVFESAGNGVRDLLGLAGGVPALGYAAKWVGATLAGALTLLATLVKGSTDALSALVAGPLRIVGGALAGDLPMVRTGAYALAAGVGSGALLVAAEAVFFVQTVIPFMLPFGRRPTEEEGERLRRVFGGSLALYNIRLYEGRVGVFSVNAHPFALGNKIFLKERSVATEPSLLVHECVHSWQYQHVGARYAGQALAAQLEHGPDAYDWTKEGERGNTGWTRFNREAQAELFEDAWNGGVLVDGEGATIASGEGAFFRADDTATFGRLTLDGTDYTDLARGAVRAVRSARSWRPSRLWG